MTYERILKIEKILAIYLLFAYKLGSHHHFLALSSPDQLPENTFKVCGGLSLSRQEEQELEQEGGRG